MREGFETAEEELTVRTLNAKRLHISLGQMFDEYKTVSNNLEDGVNLSSTLRQKKLQLEGQKKDAEVAVDTYEQEFMERRQAVPTQPRFKTLQEYVLAFFFSSYLLVAIFISLYIGRATRNTPTSIVAFMVMCATGVMISQVILRFA